jgi:iron complex outermembrane receptor protein
LDHRFNDEVLGYVSYNRGFKSGGWNPSVLPARSFAPEKLDAYEIGIKTNSADNRWRLNVSPFLYKYKDMQVESFQNAILLISNGASSKLYGVDVDAEAQVTHELRLRVGVSALHSDFTSYPAADITTPAPGGGTNYAIGSVTGNHVPLAPKAQANAGFDYTLPSPIGPFVLNATYSYNSGWFAEPDNRLRQSSYSLVNAKVTWTSPTGVYQVSGWGKNLGDTLYATSLYSQSTGDAIQFAPPRTFGIDLKVSF